MGRLRRARAIDEQVVDLAVRRRTGPFVRIYAGLSAIRRVIGHNDGHDVLMDQTRG